MPAKVMKLRSKKQREPVWIISGGKEGDQLDLYRQILKAQMSEVEPASDKMDSSLVSDMETAYLVEKSIQQALTIFILGTLMTGLLYTAMLLATPNAYCSLKSLRGHRLLTEDISDFDDITKKKSDESEMVEKDVVKLEDRDDRSATLDSFVKVLVCGALNSPGASAVVFAWTPLLLFSLATGGLITEVQLLGRDDVEVAVLDLGDVDYADDMMFLSSLLAPSLI